MLPRTILCNNKSAEKLNRSQYLSVGISFFSFPNVSSRLKRKTRKGSISSIHISAPLIHPLLRIRKKKKTIPPRGFHASSKEIYRDLQKYNNPSLSLPHYSVHGTDNNIHLRIKLCVARRGIPDYKKRKNRYKGRDRGNGKQTCDEQTLYPLKKYQPRRRRRRIPLSSRNFDKRADATTPRDTSSPTISSCNIHGRLAALVISLG